MIKIAGCDLGKASAGFFIATVRPDGSLEGGKATRVSHDGNPFGVFKTWYMENRIADCAALGATGLYADELKAPVMVFPEDACQESALEANPAFPDEMNLVSVGARGYSVLSRKPTDNCSGNNGGPRFSVIRIMERICPSSRSAGKMPNISASAAAGSLKAT